MNKYWKEIDENKHEFYFEYCNKEDLILELYKDEDGDWIYKCKSDVIKLEEFWHSSLMVTSDLEKAKLGCEEMVEQFIEDNIAYYQEILKQWKE